ncbi:hypothetical protein P7C73_g1273, partial [Tremellales sp. Uapishka_1]
MLSTTSLLLIWSTLAAAAPAPARVEKRWTTSSANCRDFYADITASATNVDIASVIGPPPVNQQALVQSSLDAMAAGSTVMAQIAAAPTFNVTETYSLWFEYCEPLNGTSAGLFQTHHGIVGNAGYWNVLINGVTDNSFAQSAAEAGWSTLSYDRLGVGRSAKPDGTNIVQANYEISESIAIGEMVRAGTLGDIGAFSTVVGVGHSYGSALLTGVAAMSDTVFDALVLTGFTANQTTGPLSNIFQSEIASEAYPARFAGDANDYVSTPSVSVDQEAFFHYPNYTQSALDLFTTTKGEYTLGQFNSLGGPLMAKRPNFNKPVFVITGDNDAPYCAADCMVTSLGADMTQLDTVKDLFPGVAAADFSTFVVPATGHGINFHTTAYAAYQQIIAFVQGAGL